jgi:cobalt/nickel transport system permease protein
LTLVLVVQAVLFADGGLLSLGANVLNMAVVGAWGGYAIYQTVRSSLGGSPRATLLAAVVAAYLSVLAAAALFCGEFVLSHGTAPFHFGQLVLWMLLYHALIGIGEAGITGAVLGFVYARRPDLLQPLTVGLATRQRRIVAAGVAAACVVAIGAAPWASAWPDGLEAVGERLEFNHLGADRVLLLSDYSVPLPAGWEAASVSAAGLLGTLVVVALGWGFARWGVGTAVQASETRLTN